MASLEVPASTKPFAPLPLTSGVTSYSTNAFTGTFALSSVGPLVRGAPTNPL
jgi:hypothetical protein